MSAAAPAFRVHRATRATPFVLGGLALVLAALVSLPAWAETADLQLTSEICCYLVIAQMWNLLAGYAGLVSVGQQAWVGLGGYTLFATAAAGLHPAAALVVGGLAAALVSIPAGFIAFRLRGPYFAIGTWVVAEVARLAVSEITPLGGGSGLSLPSSVITSLGDSDTRVAVIYYLAIALALGAVALVYGLLRRSEGLALTALRDDEDAARSLGISTLRVKFAIWILAAFGTGCAGALIFLQKLRISPDAGFSVVDWTAFPIFMTVIGGVGTIEGPFVGVAVFFILRAVLADFGAWYLVALGTVAIAVMVACPQGVWGLVRARWDVWLFPVRRRLVVAETGA